jgi:hypothetical protein
MRENDRVHRDASRPFDASSSDAVFADAAPVKVDVGKIERPAVEHLEPVGRSRGSTLGGLVRSSLVAEAPSSSRE